MLVLSTGLGATLSLSDFKSTLKSPKGIVIGLLSQFGWMPVIAFTLCHIFSLTNYQSVGLIIIGCSPGGTTSNVLSYWAEGDVALSISMSMMSTLFATFMMPILLTLYTSVFEKYTEDGLEIPYTQLVLLLLGLLVPVALGVFIRVKSLKWARRVEVIGSKIGAFAILCTVVFGVATNFDDIFTAGYQAWLCGILLSFTGFVLGFFSGYLTRLPMYKTRTVSLETGIQNSPLTLTIIAISFGEDTRDAVLIIPLLYAGVGLVVSFLVMLFYRHWHAPRYPKPKSEENKKEVLDDEKTSLLPPSNSKYDKI